MSKFDLVGFLIFFLLCVSWNQYRANFYYYF